MMWVWALSQKVALRGGGNGLGIIKTIFFSVDGKKGAVGSVTTRP